MKYNLFLDDERNPCDVLWAPWIGVITDWVVVRSYGDAMVEVLNRGFPKFISFDHDLGDETSYNGYYFAKQLVENDIISGDKESRRAYKFPSGFDFYVHSKNPVGKENIEAYLNNYLKHREEQ